MIKKRFIFKIKDKKAEYKKTKAELKKNKGDEKLQKKYLRLKEQLDKLKTQRTDKVNITKQNFLIFFSG